MHTGSQANSAPNRPRAALLPCRPSSHGGAAYRSGSRRIRGPRAISPAYGVDDEFTSAPARRCCIAAATPRRDPRAARGAWRSWWVYLGAARAWRCYPGDRHNPAADGR
jgi:hypothetical protein